MSKPYLGASQILTVGELVVIESDAPTGECGVVFEDDGQTGYFYARDFRKPDQLWVDALQIYTVEQVSDRDRPSELRIIWSKDENKAALLINDSPHAVFDFVSKAGYSRDEFPEPDPHSGWKRASWSEDLRAFFYP